MAQGSRLSIVERGMRMDPHVHISPVHMIGTLAAAVAIFGSLHLLALSSDNRASRALLALGF